MQARRLPPRTRARCAVSTTAIENPRCVLQTGPSVHRVHFAYSSSAHRPPCGADLHWPCLVRTGHRCFHRWSFAEAIGGRQRGDGPPQHCSRRRSASPGLAWRSCRPFVPPASVLMPRAGANGACRRPSERACSAQAFLGPPAVARSAQSGGPRACCEHGIPCVRHR